MTDNEMKPEFVTTWLPSAWVDECNPDGVEDLNMLIHREPERGWMLRLPEGDPDRDEEEYQQSLEPGQIIAFNAHRCYGQFRLIVADDGSYRIDRPYPEDANLFGLIEDRESIFYSLADLLAEGSPADLGHPLEPGRHDIVIWYWSDNIPHRFEVAAGAGRFVRCAGVS